jgi:tripartite-type tricarboxylate transporter receptor subunit TctC
MTCTLRNPSVRPSRRRILAGGAALVACGVAARPSALSAQTDFPQKPIRLIVPFSAGATTDFIGRAVAERFRMAFGQPVVVENRPGASTMLAAQQLTRAAPDGHTLMVATSTTLSIGPAIYKNPLIQPTDLLGVGMIGTMTHVLLVRKDFPAGSVAELVAELRRHPGRYNFGSPGSGTVHHLIVEMIKSRHKVFATHIPYNGSAQVAQDLLAGNIDFAIGDFFSTSTATIRSGRVRALAVTGASRSKLLPETPAMTEFDKGIDLAAWQGIAAPLGTPPAIVERLNAELNKALATPELADQLTQVGVTPRPMPVAELAAFLRADAPRWAEIVKRAGIEQT